MKDTCRFVPVPEISTPTRFLFWVCAFMTKFTYGFITASMAETKFITSTRLVPEMEAEQNTFTIRFKLQKISYPFILFACCPYYAYFDNLQD
jgi:hypothetical protein